MIDIYIGSLTEPDYLFHDDQIYDVSSARSVSIVGQELGIDTLTAVVADSFENITNVVVVCSSDNYEIQLSDGQIYALDVEEVNEVSNLILLPEGTPIWYYRDNVLIGKFYLNSVKRLGKNKYELDCVSVVGILDKMRHSGGLFLGAKFGDVLKDILRRRGET